MTRKQANFRLPDDLLEWLDSYVEKQGVGVNKTSVIEELLTALREDRLFLKPRSGANAFPANEVRAGESSDYPILVSYQDSRPPTK